MVLYLCEGDDMFRPLLWAINRSQLNSLKNLYNAVCKINFIGLKFNEISSF
jgi:hypothetical protein